MTAATSPPRTYDVICFGDEVPGIMAMVAASREVNRRTGRRFKGLLMFKGNSQEGVGGHLVRGGLAYLDRSTVPPDVRRSLNLSPFGDPCSLYKELLQRAGVAQVALDRFKADAALRKMLSDACVDIISRVEIQSVLTAAGKITGIVTNRGETFLAKQFIDCTVNAELAQFAGVNKLKGFETFGLPDSELPVTLIFETQGLTPQRLKDVEMAYLRRLTNPNDVEAQRFITLAAGNDTALADFFRKDLVDAQGNLKTLCVGQDNIDVRCRALAIFYHAFRGKKLVLEESKIVLDQANIACLPGGRLSWNALLCYTTGSEAEALARAGAKPTSAMLDEINYIERWLKSVGATAVTPMTELYIRHAGNVKGVVEPLSGAQMLQGGVPATEALATFSYHLDVRGGITGLGLRAVARGIDSITFPIPPLFNVGIHHALLKTPPNLAVVSPGSGFTGYACAAGRIVEFNVAVGQGVGIAAAIALTTNRNLSDITNRDVQQVLTQTGLLPKIYGRSNLVEASRLQSFETAIVA
jgi:hypothetical protein